MSCDGDQVVIRQGDLLPAFNVDVETDDGTEFDLTDWTLTLEMSGPVEVTGSASWAAGEGLTYAWAAGDTDVPGVYQVVIRGVSPAPESLPRTFPTRGALTLIIEPV
jgi:hypothetical protein